MNRIDMSSVSITAHYTAYGWHLLGVPEAHRFATRKGRFLHRLSRPFIRLAPLVGLRDPMVALLESRHRLLEHLLTRDGGRTFVELAAGLSPRGTAYSRVPEVRYVEVDLPRMSALKAQLVGDARGSGQRFEAGDVTDPELYARLLEHVRGRAPVTVVSEGLNAYLPRAALEQMIEHVADFLGAAGGGRFVLDVNPADALARFGVIGQGFVRAIEAVARWRLPMPVRSAADGAAMLASAGFREVRVHDPRTHPACAAYDFSGTRGAVLVLEGTIR